MKLRKLALLPAAAAAIAFGTPAIANSLTFQGVTFETQAVDSDTLQFSILNADTGATGNWTGIDFLNAFSMKDIGNVTGATISPANFTVSEFELTTGGCVGGASGGICFTASPAPLDLNDNMSWIIDFTGTDLTFASPHLKVLFSGGDVGNGHGDLLSQNITPAIPEPETYAMMLAGLGLLGFVARRRRQGLGGNLVPA